MGRDEAGRAGPRFGARWRRVAGSASAMLIAAGLSGCGSNGSTATAALNPQFVKAGTLTVCTSFPYAPFEFRRNGQAQGFDIDLAKAVANELDVKPVIVNADFGDIQSGKVLNEGTCDVAVAGITITGDRARVLDFSSPYFDAAQALVVKQDSSVEGLDDLAGGRIGVQGGTTGEIYVTDNAPKDTKIVPFADAGEVTDALLHGDVDAAVYDNTVVGSVVARDPQLQVVEQFNTGEQYGMAVKKNANVDLLRFINNVLAKLKSDGGYDRIYNRWFGGSTDH